MTTCPECGRAHDEPSALAKIERIARSAEKNVTEARDLAWELWMPPTLGVNDLKVREIFDMWRAEGWKPFEERENDGKGKDEEDRG